MKDKVSVFLPTRSGSERILNKNTKQFANIEGGLLALKLMQLENIKSVDEIILSTNDPICIEIAEKFILKYESKLIIDHRPENLALSTTELTDLIQYAASICSFPNILWTHVTSPFVNDEDYDKAIKQFFLSINDGYDSLMSVKLIKSFLWDNEINDIINRADLCGSRWPRTQDLKNIYEIDSSIFLSKKESYISNKDRVGIKPFLFVQNDLKSFDIDWEFDFKLAEHLYKNDIIL